MVPVRTADPTGQLTALASPLGTATWTWLDNQRLGAQTLPNDAWTEYTYLPNGRLSGLTNKDAGGNVLSRYYAMHYAGTGDLLSLAVEVPGETSLSGTTSYAYDAKRQLIRQPRDSEASSRAGGWDHAFGYDGAGNPTAWQGQTRTFNADNQETTGSAFIYDGNGNPTSYGGVSLSFDVENRLTSYGTALTAGYRPDGLRAWKEASGQGTAVSEPGRSRRSGPIGRLRHSPRTVAL